MNINQLEERMKQIDKLSQAMKAGKLSPEEKISCLEQINLDEKVIINEQKKRQRKVEQMKAEIETIISFFEYRSEQK